MAVHILFLILFLFFHSFLSFKYEYLCLFSIIFVRENRGYNGVTISKTFPVWLGGILSILKYLRQDCKEVKLRKNKMYFFQNFIYTLSH
jgi:hypothetical protein